QERVEPRAFPATGYASACASYACAVAWRRVRMISRGTTVYAIGKASWIVSLEVRRRSFICLWGTCFAQSSGPAERHRANPFRYGAAILESEGFIALRE